MWEPPAGDGVWEGRGREGGGKGRKRGGRERGRKVEREGWKEGHEGKGGQREGEEEGRKREGWERERKERRAGKKEGRNERLEKESHRPRLYEGRHMKIGERENNKGMEE